MGSCAGRVYAFDILTGDTLWTYNAAPDGASQFHGAPVIAGDTLFIATDEGNEQRGSLYALDRLSGTAFWKQPADPGLPSNLVQRGGLVYGVSRDDRLVAFSRDTGQPMWKFQPSELYGSGSRVSRGRLVASDPLVYKDLVIFAARDNTIHAVDAATGEARWMYPHDAGITTQLFLAGDRIAFGTDVREILMLGADGGDFVAAYPLTRVPYGAMSYRPSSLVYLAGDFEAHPRHVAAIDLGNGRPLWERELDDPDPKAYWYVPRIERWRKTVVVGSTKGLVAAYEATTGETAWTIQLEGAIRGIGHSGDTLLVGTFEGTLYALEAHED